MTIDEITQLHAATDAAKAVYDQERTPQTYTAYLAAMVARNTVTVDLVVAAFHWSIDQTEAHWLALVAAWRAVEGLENTENHR